MSTQDDRRAVQEHLRNHLTDGFWHDDCPMCRHRRRHGGNGLSGVAATPESAPIGPGSAVSTEETV